MATDTAALDPQGRRALRRFIRRMRRTGDYSDRQLETAAQSWASNYQRGVRDDKALAWNAQSEARRQGAPGLLADLEAGEDMEGAELAESLTEDLPGDASLDAALDEATTAEELIEILNAEESDQPFGGEVLNPWSEQAPVAAAPAPRSEILDPWADERPEVLTETETETEVIPAGPQLARPRESNEEIAAGMAAQQPAKRELGWKDYAAPVAGVAGAALGAMAPSLTRDRAYESELRGRIAGDTVARREGALAAGQLSRAIGASARGRRDAAARAGTDVMAQAAIASARERQAAQKELADIRKARLNQQVNAGMAGLSQMGAWLSGQAAAERQDERQRQNFALAQERNRIARERNEIDRNRYDPRAAPRGDTTDLLLRRGPRNTARGGAFVRTPSSVLSQDALEEATLLSGSRGR